MSRSGSSSSSAFNSGPLQKHSRHCINRLAMTIALLDSGVFDAGSLWRHVELRAFQPVCVCVCVLAAWPNLVRFLLEYQTSMEVDRVTVWYEYSVSQKLGTKSYRAG